MKKLLLPLLLLLLLALPARADTARDVTAECRIVVINNKKESSRFMLDRDEVTLVSTDNYRHPRIEITTGDTPVAAVFVEFARTYMPFEVQHLENKEWVTVGQSNAGFAQEYAQFPPQTGKLRLVFDSDIRALSLAVDELYLFSEGERDEIIAHEWQPTAEKADILFLTTHPDDEILWFGGAIPTYAGARGLRTTVVYATCDVQYRLQELLNGLWHCGVRTYPVVGDFDDFATSRYEDVLLNWGEKALTDFLVRQIRAARPEVLVTQDLDGEYGHANHIAVARTCVQAVQLAADAAYDGGSLAELGPWQVKKFYVHLGDAPTTVLDYHQPLDFFGGKDAYQVAVEAFAYHRSQGDKYHVHDVGEPYDSSVYTLLYSTVGPDEAGNDFFEHLE